MKNMVTELELYLVNWLNNYLACINLRVFYSCLKIIPHYTYKPEMKELNEINNK